MIPFAAAFAVGFSATAVLLVALDRRRLTLSPHAVAILALSELQSPHRHSP